MINQSLPVPRKEVNFVTGLSQILSKVFFLSSNMKIELTKCAFTLKYWNDNKKCHSKQYIEIKVDKKGNIILILD